jgi:hypothetical protein
MRPSDCNWVDIRLLTLLWLVIAVSALSFVLAVQAPVFDDLSNLQDVLRYSKQALSIDTLKQHVNPAGPFAYIWIALVGKLLGGQLWSFRLANALTMSMFGGVLLGLCRWYPFVCSATCLLFVNPYLPLASATILTEVPSLLLLISGTMLWLQGISEQGDARTKGNQFRSAAKLLVGGVLLGLSITGRQYYLVVLPAMAVVVLVVFMIGSQRPSRLGVVATLAGGFFAALPIIGLFTIWGGLTPPNMQEAISYSDSTAKIGLNPLRPVTTILYIGFYVLPVLILQRDMQLRVLLWLASFAIILAGLIVLVVPQDYLWCAPKLSHACGPISSLYNIVVSKAPRLAPLYNGLIAFVGVSGFLLFLRSAWLARSSIAKAPPIIFALVFLLSFVIEQVFVGGNIPFYERYILQISPILGLMLSADARFAIDRAVIGAIPFLIVGQFRLWQFAM